MLARSPASLAAMTPAARAAATAAVAARARVPGHRRWGCDATPVAEASTWRCSASLRFRSRSIASSDTGDKLVPNSDAELVLIKGTGFLGACVP